MKRTRAAILAAMAICAGHVAFAQAPPAAPAPQGRGGASPAASVISPEIAADRMVTFRIYAPNAQAIRLVGSTPEVLNNQGFSYILRGDYRRARAILMEAQAAAPNNPYIKNNLRLLSASERKAKAVN